MDVSIYRPKDKFLRNYPYKTIFVGFSDHDYIPRYLDSYYYFCTNVEVLDPYDGKLKYVPYENQIALTNASPKEYLLKEFEKRCISDLLIIRKDFNRQVKAYEFSDFFDEERLTAKVHRFQRLAGKVYYKDKEMDLEASEITFNSDFKEFVMKNNVLVPHNLDVEEYVKDQKIIENGYS